MAEASITYTYTGNDYTVFMAPYTGSMDITGSFTFASPLAPSTIYTNTDLPTTWSISDGVDTITNTTGTLGFDAITNSLGGIVAWAFLTPIPGTTFFAESVNDPGKVFGVASPPCSSTNVCDAVWGTAVGHLVGIAGVLDDPGTWRPTSTVPEPAFAFPLAVLMAVIAGMAHKRTAPIRFGLRGRQ
ncbi:MAG: hypothetical protein JO099_10380 [Acidobacteriia bacterium]|nr:hypothetical protein [Terriglobia bacterium]